MGARGRVKRGGLGGAGDGGEVLEEGHKIMPLYKSLIYI